MEARGVNWLITQVCHSVQEEAAIELGLTRRAVASHLTSLRQARMPFGGEENPVSGYETPALASPLKHPRKDHPEPRDHDQEGGLAALFARCTDLERTNERLRAELAQDVPTPLLPLSARRWALAFAAAVANEEYQIRIEPLQGLTLAEQSAALALAKKLLDEVAQ
jgi:hypothetical protein